MAPVNTMAGFQVFITGCKNTFPLLRSILSMKKRRRSFRNGGARTR